MALSWLLKDERVTSLLIGATPPEQIHQNVRALHNLHLTPDELQRIDRHVADGVLNVGQGSSVK
ncbi:aldo/keto reductase, partial [Enterobacter sichuanensis]